MSLSTDDHMEPPTSEKSLNWLSTLIKKGKDKVSDEERANKIIFKIQSADWDKKQNEINFSQDEMIKQAQLLVNNDVTNIGVYPGMKFKSKNIFSNLKKEKKLTV